MTGSDLGPETARRAGTITGTRILTHLDVLEIEGAFAPDRLA